MNTYFAPSAKDQEGTVALVTREAQEECRDGRLPPLVLDSCVHEAVESLRGSHSWPCDGYAPVSGPAPATVMSGRSVS
jgi:hypothetical protein